MTEPLLDHTWSALQDRYPELLHLRVNEFPFHVFPIRPAQRRLVRRRSQLCAALTNLYGLATESASQLRHDNLHLAILCQRFLGESGLAWTWPVVERRSREVHDWDARFEILTTALTGAVARGRDNELFVLLLDLVDYTGSLERLRQIIRVARARHHRIVLICPLPDETSALWQSRLHDGPSATERLVERAERARLTATSQRLRRGLQRMGIPVSFAADRRTVQLTLIEAGLARGGRSASRIRS